MIHLYSFVVLFLQNCIETNAPTITTMQLITSSVCRKQCNKSFAQGLEDHVDVARNIKFYWRAAKEAEKANAEKANAIPRSKFLGPTKIERIKAPHITEANLTAYGFQATKTDHKEEQRNTKDTCIYI